MKKSLLEEFLMDDTDCIPIEQAIAEAKKKWPQYYLTKKSAKGN